MSLLVLAYRRGPDSREVVWVTQSPTPPHNDLAGFEACRSSVYAGPEARGLKLHLLPELAETDIYADGPDLEQLKREVEALRKRYLALGEEGVVFRLDNILEAVRLAEEEPDGGVYIG